MEARQADTKKLKNGILPEYLFALESKDGACETSQEDAEYIKGYHIRKEFHLTWWEYQNQPKWVNEADYALLKTEAIANKKDV